MTQQETLIEQKQETHKEVNLLYSATSNTYESPEIRTHILRTLRKNKKDSIFP